MRPRVKICGVTRLCDARLAAALGADRIGCVLASDSPRRVDRSVVRRVVDELSERCEVVLVFRDAVLDDILRTTRSTGARSVQLHGADEAQAQGLEQRGLSVTRVLGVTDATRRLVSLQPAPTSTRPHLIDTGRGGTGRAFDWRLLGRRAPAFTYVAGGITPANVQDLLDRAPYGIDVAGGVESAPGIKCPTRMRALFATLEGLR